MSDTPFSDLVRDMRVPPPPAAAANVPAPPGAVPDNPFVGNQPASTVPQPPSRRPAELRAAEYSPRERIGNWMQDALISAGAKPYVAGRVGRGALDAASLIPPVGGSIAAADAGYYANRGDPIMAGVSGLGMVPGGTALRRGVQGMPQRTLAPEAEQLAAAKTQAYDAWRQAPITYAPGMMDDVSNAITQTLIQQGFDPATKQSALNIGQGLKRQTGMTNNDFEILRRQLSGGRDRTEIAAGEAAKNALETYMLNPPQQHIRSGTPQQIAAARENLLTGRGNAAAEFRDDVISGRVNAAEIAEERGRSFSGTYRDRMGALSSTRAGEKAMRGFTDIERDRVRDEVSGSLLERATGGAGRAIDRAAPYVSGIGTVATGSAGALGKAFGLDPVTAAAAGALGYAGGKVAGKGLQGYSTDLARRSADELGATIRMRSPLAQAPGSPYGQITDPMAQVSDARKYLMYPWLRQEGEETVEQNRVPFELR